MLCIWSCNSLPTFGVGTPLFSTWEPWPQTWSCYFSSQLLQTLLQTAPVQVTGSHLIKSAELSHLHVAEMRFWDHQTQHLPPPLSRKRFNEISDNQFDLLLEMQTNLSLRLYTVTKKPNLLTPNTHNLQLPQNTPGSGKRLLQVQGRIYVELGISTWVSYKKNIPNTVVMKMETT